MPTPRTVLREFHGHASFNDVVTVLLTLIVVGIVALPERVTAAPNGKVPVPVDAAYGGVIELHVDATEVETRIFRVKERIPVKPGKLTLLYAQWLPGSHAPDGPIEALAGVTITANGKSLQWIRDPENVFAFHLQVPSGSNELQVELQYASPQARVQGRITSTPEIVGVQWEKMLLYPAGIYASRIEVAASLDLPQGWGYGTALRASSVQNAANKDIHFQRTSLETLVDSPLFAGKYFRREELDPGASAPITLNIVADTPEELNIQPQQLAAHRKLVQEAKTLFSSEHFDHYDFLLSISDHFSNIGLEHHRSSEDGVHRGYFKDWDKTATARDLLAHEFTHSWNGKFRRPADLWTPNYNVPMQNSLLWVYEGQTQYWGFVLAARSGLWTADLTRDAIASTAAVQEERRQGRTWRPLEDTTEQPIITPRRPLSFVSWQRTEDYYTEGALIWLDVDTRLRELSDGKRSLDDFAKAFFGVKNGSYVPDKYTFDDLVRVLESVAPNNWSAFLHERLDHTASKAPLEGLERSGWRLAFTAEQSEYSKKSDALNERHDFSYSIGLVLDKDAKLTEVVWDSPAFKAGLTTAGTLVAVNGIAYKPENLEQAIRDTKDRHIPLELLVQSLDHFRTVKLDYDQGLRYPRLERVADTPDRLAEILKPRT
jgi:predicted metalloprotease with PDZ domain